MQERVLRFEGIHNFRDYGGYAARGGRLAHGRLWRSGQHAGASADDLARVHALEIATVIDLRGDSERTLYPCLRHEEFSGDVLFEPGETSSRSGRPAHEELAEAARSEDDARTAMVRLYETLAYRPVLVGTFRLYVEALATRDGASLLHCLAGKDRTGVGVALVHALLGVHADDIMADYLLTNTAGDPDARIAALRKTVGGSASEAALRVMLGVEPEYLDATFAAIRASHGSVEAYATDVLGAGPDRIAAIEARLVV